MNACTHQKVCFDPACRIAELTVVAAPRMAVALAIVLTMAGVATAQVYTVTDLPDEPVVTDVQEGAVIEGPIFDPGTESILGPPATDAEPLTTGITEGTEWNSSAASEYAITDMDGTSGGGTMANLWAPGCQRWTAQVDALFLWQGAIPSRPLFSDSITNATVLNANQAQSPVSVAPRYAIMFHRDSCRAFEINYFQIQSFAGDASVGPGPNPYASNNVPGVPVNDVTEAGVATTASLKSWEFNLRRSNGGIITWLAGFRWVEWNQQMAIADLNTGGTTGVDTYYANTGNNLYGGQLGADMMLWNAGRKLKVNGIAKGGLFYNHQAYQTTSLGGDQTDNFYPSYTLSATKDAPSFFGEVALIGEYKLTNWLAWRAGYTLFWLGGIATPANQLGLSDFAAQTTSINTYSSALLPGVTPGLEAGG
jgi:hypothetical protein